MWRVAFDYSTSEANIILYSGSLARLRGGACRRLRFDKLTRSYQAPAHYTNFKGGNGAMSPDILLPSVINKLTIVGIQLFRAARTLFPQLDDLAEVTTGRRGSGRLCPEGVS